MKNKIEKWTETRDWKIELLGGKIIKIHTDIDKISSRKGTKVKIKSKANIGEQK